MRPGVSGRGRQRSLGGGTYSVPALMGRSGGTSPVRAHRERCGVRLLLPGCLEASVVLASASFWTTLFLRGRQSSRWLSVFFLPLVVQQQVLWWYRLSPGSSSCVSPRWLLVNFLLFLDAWTLGNLEHYFVVALYLAVLSLVLGVARGVQVLDFSGDAAFHWGNVWLDSEYMFCNSTGRFLDELHTFFLSCCGLQS